MFAILGKIISMFSIVFVGYGASRVGWLPTVCSRYLSNLLINISAPCVILVTMSEQVLNRETGKVTLLVLALSILLYGGCTLLGFLAVKLIRIPVEKRGVYVFCVTYSNNGFLGMAVAQAVLGSTGLFVMVISNVTMGLFIYTLGILTITYGMGGKKDWKQSLKSMINVPLIANLIGVFLFLFQIRLPGLLTDFMNQLGGMMVPLSMLIIGIQLAENGIRYTVRQVNLYGISAIRLAVLPAIAFLLMHLVGIPPMVLAVMTLTVALPPAALGPVLSETYGGNTSLAAGCVSLGTFLSLFTVPAVCALLVAYIGQV